LPTPYPLFDVVLLSDRRAVDGARLGGVEAMCSNSICVGGGVGWEVEVGEEAVEGGEGFSSGSAIVVALLPC
jgi:hypothetical protein